MDARVVTLAGPRRRRGKALGELGVVARGDVRIEGGVIAEVAEHGARREGQVFACGGRVLMPAFVDCHTHACWAGSRVDEWERLRAGTPYLEILASGGGIMSTVRAVRAASVGELAEALRERIGGMARSGSLTIEVKSGYGLRADDELKMLEAIEDARRWWERRGVTIVPTALLGHAIEGERGEFVERTVRETLERVHERFPGVAVDAYCENGAWSVEECERLFTRAKELGHRVRVHADQFNALGMTRWAAGHGAVSVDHLEASGDEDLEALARSETFGVMLPNTGFHMAGAFARGRELVDRGGLAAIATNLNPGSAPCGSMQMAVAIAVRRLGLTVAEAIAAGTVHGAEVLGLHDRGQIAPGQRADLLLLTHRDERMPGYEFGGNCVERIWAGGRVFGE